MATVDSFELTKKWRINAKSVSALNLLEESDVLKSWETQFCEWEDE